MTEEELEEYARLEYGKEIYHRWHKGWRKIYPEKMRVYRTRYDHSEKRKAAKERYNAKPKTKYYKHCWYKINTRGIASWWPRKDA
jgi:hypothetical protein